MWISIHVCHHRHVQRSLFFSITSVFHHHGYIRVKHWSVPWPNCWWSVLKLERTFIISGDEDGTLAVYPLAPECIPRVVLINIITPIFMGNPPHNRTNMHTAKRRTAHNWQVADKMAVWKKTLGFGIETIDMLGIDHSWVFSRNERLLCLWQKTVKKIHTHFRHSGESPLWLCISLSLPVGTVYKFLTNLCKCDQCASFSLSTRSWISFWILNSFSSGQSDHIFANDIFRRIFLNEK